MLSVPSQKELEFNILMITKKRVWVNIHNAADGYLEQYPDISRQDYIGRIDFLANRACIDMRKPSTDSASIYIKLSDEVPDGIFDLASLVNNLHQPTKS